MVVANIPKRNLQFLDIPYQRCATLNYGTDMVGNSLRTYSPCSLN